jgi:hypothetical protein
MFSCQRSCKKVQKERKENKKEKKSTPIFKTQIPLATDFIFFCDQATKFKIPYLDLDPEHCISK